MKKMTKAEIRVEKTEHAVTGLFSALGHANHIFAKLTSDC